MEVGNIVRIKSKIQMESVLLHSLSDISASKATHNAVSENRTFRKFSELWEKTDGVFTVNNLNKNSVELITDDFFYSDSESGDSIVLPKVDVLFEIVK